MKYAPNPLDLCTCGHVFVMHRDLFAPANVPCRVDGCECSAFRDG